VRSEFYLFWPPIVLLRAGRRSLAIVTAGVSLGGLILRFALLDADHWNARAVFLMPSQMDALGFGSHGLRLRPHVGCSLPSALFRRHSWRVFSSAAGLFDQLPATATLQFVVPDTSKVLMFGGLIALVVARRVRVLELTPLAWLGRISYCVYVRPRMLGEFLERLSLGTFSEPRLGWARFWLLSCGSIAVAAASWRWLEARSSCYYTTRFRYNAAATVSDVPDSDPPLSK